MDLSFPTLIVTGLSGIVGGLVAFAAAAIARRQNRLSATGIAADWLRDLRAWASEAIDVLCEAQSDLAADSGTTRVGTRHRLSALIDRGRLLLPNEKQQEYGTHKQKAYQGYRHAALDALVAAYRALGPEPALFEFDNPALAVKYLRKEFVTVVQGILDPASANRVVADLLKQAYDARAKDPTVGGILPHPEEAPQGATRMLYLASLRYVGDRKREQKLPSPRPG